MSRADLIAAGAVEQVDGSLRIGRRYVVTQFAELGELWFVERRTRGVRTPRAWALTNDGLNADEVPSYLRHRSSELAKEQAAVYEEYNLDWSQHPFVELGELERLAKEDDDTAALERIQEARFRLQRIGYLLLWPESAVLQLFTE